VIRPSVTSCHLLLFAPNVVKRLVSLSNCVLQCFMEPLKKVQVEGFLMFAEPQELFGNLDELCYVSPSPVFALYLHRVP